MFNPANYTELGLRIHDKQREKQIYELKKQLGQLGDDHVAMECLKEQHRKWKLKKKESEYFNPLNS